MLASLSNGHMQWQALNLAHGQLLLIAVRRAGRYAHGSAMRCAGVIIKLTWDAGELRAAGIESMLRHLIEIGAAAAGVSAAGAAGSGRPPAAGIGGGVDREVRERTRRALEAMEGVVVAEDI